MSNFKKNINRIKSVWCFAKPYLMLFILAEICILIMYSISLALPLVLTNLIDKVLISKQYDLLDNIIWTYVILFTINIAINLIYSYTWQTLNNNYVVDVKVKTFDKAIHSKYKFLSNMNSGDIMSRIDGDADQFIHVIQRNLFHFVNSIIMCICILYIVSRISIVISVILLITEFLPMLLTKISSKFVEKYSKKIRDVTGDLTGKAFEIFKGIREIKIFSAQSWATNVLFTKFKKIIKLQNKNSGVNFIVDKGTYLVNLVTSILLYGYSLQLILKGQLTPGYFLAIIQYIALFHRKFSFVLMIYMDWHGRKVSIDRVNEVLQSDTEEDVGDNLNKKISDIRFDKVTFGYNENIVLKDISFDVKAGEKVAIVGASGAGKTTITGLLLKFFEPQSGTIYINGKDISNIKYSEIRKNIAIVQQDILLFDETIRYNLTLGVKCCSDEELLDLCKKAGLYETIMKLPKKLDTKLGKNGQNLSGGQLQRLMILRIYLKNAGTVIFDEATSALDQESEMNVLNLFSELSSNSSMIIISHRLSTIRNCDKVIVLENGRIQDIGSHEFLIENCKTYKKMFSKNKGVA